MNVICVNPECPERDVPKSNPANFPVAIIRCGECGQPAEEAPE
jgi:hypothetical protein